MPPESIEPSTSDPAGGVGATALPDGPGAGVVEAVPEGTVDVAVASGEPVGEQATRPRSAAIKPARAIAKAIRGHIVGPAMGPAS
jgi:hypothetical protein